MAALEACGTHRHTWDDFLALNFLVSLLGTLSQSMGEEIIFSLHA